MRRTTFMLDTFSYEAILRKLWHHLQPLVGTIRQKTSPGSLSIWWLCGMPDPNSPKSRVVGFDETNNFRVENLFIWSNLQEYPASTSTIGRNHQAENLTWIFEHLVIVWYAGSKWPQKQSCRFRRDEQLLCREFVHMRPSWGCFDSFLQVISPGKFRPKSKIAKFRLSYLAFLFDMNGSAI